MQSEKIFPLGLRIIIPLLVGLAVNFWPRPLSLELAYQHLQLAHADSRQQAEIVALQQAVKIEPWRSEIWENIGKDELAIGDLDNSISAYRQASLLNGLSPAGSSSLGDALLRKGQREEALKVWQACLSSDSANAELYKKVFDLQTTLGKYEAALGTLHSWLEFQPGNPQVNFQMALLIAASQPRQA